MKIALYDTTLRDGAQREGISFSVEDKLRIAAALDRLGIDYIEGGWPGSNPKDMEFFARVKEIRLEHAVVTAFGSTRRAGTAVEDDRNVKGLLSAGTSAVTVVGKSWDKHVTYVLKTTRDENLRMISETVAYLKSVGRKVIYDAEHFFDGYQTDPGYALATLHAARDAGADVIVLCDTNGGVLPASVAAVVAAVKEKIDAPLGIHAHNDSETAVANTVAAVVAGAVHLQGTINGYGERCGNANLCSVIPALKLKLGYDCVPDEKLALLTDTAYYVSELSNLPLDRNIPYVGKSAFAHKGGMHVNALLKWEGSYQHIDPKLVGNRRRVLISELSGRSNITYKARELGLELPEGSPQAERVLHRVKELEREGFQFEGADGSVELLVRRESPDYRAPFTLRGFHVLVKEGNGGGMVSEATVKVEVNGQVMHTAAEGNGPVDALNVAVRKALLPFYPHLSSVRLTDYKVRILDGEAGTAARTRVLITSSDRHCSWSTVGSSSNIIEASWYALADALEYGLLIMERELV
ncbi:MAG: citramalate synthase [Candidatus Bipolaricaulota bacterium]|nr:citramalate synthase [Candidatus Bipolaricaulota bacterium]